MSQNDQAPKEHAPKIISDLQIEVEGQSIMVTRSGTSFRSTFFKAGDERRLVKSPAMSVEKAAPSDNRKEFVPEPRVITFDVYKSYVA